MRSSVSSVPRMSVVWPTMSVARPVPSTIVIASGVTVRRDAITSSPNALVTTVSSSATTHAARVRETGAWTSSGLSTVASMHTGWPSRTAAMGTIGRATRCRASRRRFLHPIPPSAIPIPTPQNATTTQEQLSQLMRAEPSSPSNDRA